MMPSIRPNSAEFDCVILGGGTAGCAAALTLLEKDAGLRVAIIDAGRHPGERVGESLPPQSAELLHRLGVWDAFVGDEHQPCPGFMSCWGHEEPGCFDFFTLPYGSAWTLDREQFDETLIRTAEQSGVHIFRNSKVLHVSSKSDGLTVIDYRDARLQGHHPVRCFARFVIDATGRRSWLTRRMRTGQQRYDQLIMLATRVAQHSVNATQSMTMIEAAEYGWWYSTTLPGGDKLIGLFTDSDIARKWNLFNVSPWQGRMTQTRYTHEGLATDFNIDKLTILPAMSCRPLSSHGDNWLAVGDAAGTCDPLSAQGIYRALSDGIDGANAVYRAVSENTAEHLEAHVEKRCAKYARYLQQRRQYYSLETRWNRKDFWCRRIQTDSTADVA